MLRKLTTFKNAQLRDTRIQTRRTQTLKPIFLDETNSKYFNFQSLESNIYNWWDTSGFFKPTPLKSTKQSFVVPMPPPNVTGHLHMGHAVFISLQDIVVRFKRMRQQSTLWLPGT
jgi:valyl-tRNA synthetase